MNTEQGESIRAVVTGGGSGIGKAVACEWAARGASVTAADIRFEHDDPSPGVRCVTADVTQEDDMRRLMPTAAGEHGRIDVLITAAGILGPFQVPVEEVSLADWERVIAVNLTGTFLAIKHALPYLERAGGHGVVLCIGSGAGVRGPSSSVPYGASKGGVHGLGITLAPKLAKRGIRMHVVCPAGVATPMKLDAVRRGAQNQGLDPAEVEAEVEKVAETLGDPAEAVRGLVALASEDAASLRGTIFMQ